MFQTFRHHFGRLTPLLYQFLNIFEFRISIPESDRMYCDSFHESHIASWDMQRLLIAWCPSHKVIPFILEWTQPFRSIGFENVLPVEDGRSFIVNLAASSQDFGMKMEPSYSLRCNRKVCVVFSAFSDQEEQFVYLESDEFGEVEESQPERIGGLR